MCVIPPPYCNLSDTTIAVGQHGFFSLLLNIALLLFLNLNDFLEIKKCPTYTRIFLRHTTQKSSPSTIHHSSQSYFSVFLILINLCHTKSFVILYTWTTRRLLWFEVIVNTNRPPFFYPPCLSFLSPPPIWRGNLSLCYHMSPVSMSVIPCLLDKSYFVWS